MCFHHRGRILKTTKNEMGASILRFRAMRSCALVRPEVDAAALKPRSLPRPANYDTDKTRGVEAAEFFDLRRLQSRHQSLAAFDGGDACLPGTLSPNLAKASTRKEKRK